MAVVKWAGQLVAWMATFVVARLLSPSDYGVVGAASLYLGLLTIVSEFGLGSAVVVLRTLSPSQIRQINTISALFGLVGFGFSALLAPEIARFFHAPAVGPVVVALSATFLIGSFKTVPWSLLQRDMRFRRVAAFEGAQQITLAILSVTLAALGFRYWTLVIASVASAIIPAGLAVTLHWVGYEIPRRRDVGRALAFSKEIILQRIAWYTYSNSDFLVAGRVLGESALGAYTLAWTIAHAPLDKIGNVILQVAPPALSAVQGDVAALRRYVMGITEGIALVTFPLFAGLALVAPDFVPIVLGPQWRTMVVPLQLLATYACFRAVLPLLSQVLVLTGHERFAARNMMLAAVVLPIAFFVASRWGITGIALAWMLVHPLIAYRVCTRAFATLKVSFREFVAGPLWPALSACLLMATGVTALRLIWPHQWPAGVRLAAEVALGAAVYLVSLAVLHRDRLRAIRSLGATLRAAEEASA